MGLSMRVKIWKQRLFVCLLDRVLFSFQDAKTKGEHDQYSWMLVS